jgi:cell division septum initiation protein DivIVA
MFIVLNIMITFFFYFQETYNNRLRERYGDDILTHPEFDPDLWMEVGSSGGPDKNQVYGLSNITADNLRSTRSVSTVGSSQSISSSQSKKFVALQQHTAQLTEKCDNLKAEYAELKASHAQQRAEQRAESEQLKVSQAQQKAEYEATHEQQKAAYEQLREMIMNLSNGGTCAPNLFWPYNHQPSPGSPPSPPAPSLY